MRRKWTIAAAIPAVMFSFCIAARETIDQINKHRAYPVIQELGGRIGSIPPPIPFAGSELRIAFENTQFKDGDLKRLSVLRPLTSKHYVGVMFKDTNVSEDDIVELRAALPDCAIFRVVDSDVQDDR